MMGRVLASLALFGACAGMAAERARSEFRFILEVPYDLAAPLFGAFAEQNWAPEWKPEFLFPVPPADQEGAVFRVAHDGHSAAWVMTDFDLARGHVQYVCVLDGLLLTRIDIRLVRAGEGKTGVAVAYERTSLAPAADDHVRTLAEADARQGPEWKAAIEKYVAKYLAQKKP